jgi:hypothetical protein
MTFYKATTRFPGRILKIDRAVVESQTEQEGVPNIEPIPGSCQLLTQLLRRINHATTNW